MLREICVDISRRVLDFTVGFARELTEDYSEQHNERHEAENHKSQLIVQAEHCNENADYHEHILDKVDENVCEHHGDGVRVVCYSCDKLADRDGVLLCV